MLIAALLIAEGGSEWEDTMTNTEVVKEIQARCKQYEDGCINMNELDRLISVYLSYAHDENEIEVKTSDV